MLTVFFTSFLPKHAFSFRRVKSHRGLCCAAFPLSAVWGDILLPLRTSSKANYSFCNNCISIVPSITVYGYIPPRYCGICTEKTQIPLGIAPAENISRSEETTPFPFPASPRTLWPPLISPAALSRQNKASATWFNPHDHAHLLFFPVLYFLLCWRAEGRTWGRSTAHIPFLPEALLKNIINCCHEVDLLLLGLHYGTLDCDIWKLPAEV